MGDGEEARVREGREVREGRRKDKVKREGRREGEEYSYRRKVQRGEREKESG